MQYRTEFEKFEESNAKYEYEYGLIFSFNQNVFGSGDDFANSTTKNNGLDRDKNYYILSVIASLLLCQCKHILVKGQIGMACDILCFLGQSSPQTACRIFIRIIVYTKLRFNFSGIKSDFVYQALS